MGAVEKLRASVPKGDEARFWFTQEIFSLSLFMFFGYGLFKSTTQESSFFVTASSSYHPKAYRRGEERASGCRRLRPDPSDVL